MYSSTLVSESGRRALESSHACGKAKKKLRNKHKAAAVQAANQFFFACMAQALKLIVNH